MLFGEWLTAIGSPGASPAAIRSAVFVPMKIRDRVFGVLTAAIHSGKWRFSERDLYYLSYIARNAAHAIEMGHDPDREPPFFFQKNPDNLDPSGQFPYPPHSDDVHHEVELLIALKSGGRDIPVETALDHVYGYGVALDMTRLEDTRKAL